MSEKLWGLKARTAERLTRLLADGGAVGGRARSGAPARGLVWVKVTGGPDGDGWHPGVVSLDQAGGFEDLAAEVLVAAPDGGDLVDGRRYQCSRTGDDADGVARFRADAPASLEYGSVVGWLGTSGSTSTPFSGWMDLTDLEIDLPDAGVYLVTCSVSGEALSGSARYMSMRLVDAAAPAVGIADTYAKICHALSGGTATAVKVLAVAAPATIKAQLLVATNSGTVGWTIRGAGEHTEGASVLQFLRLTGLNLAPGGATGTDGTGTQVIGGRVTAVGDTVDGGDL